VNSEPRHSGWWSAELRTPIRPERLEHEDDDEHEDEALVADFGVSSVERYSALCLCGETLQEGRITTV
jgi:hypothetical protein